MGSFPRNNNLPPIMQIKFQAFFYRHPSPCCGGAHQGTQVDIIQPFPDPAYKYDLQDPIPSIFNNSRIPTLLGSTPYTPHHVRIKMLRGISGFFPNCTIELLLIIPTTQSLTMFSFFLMGLLCMLCSYTCV